MAFHDPDSNQREHAMALKVGRQKRIQEIDGQQVEIYSGIDDEEYEGESDYEEYIDGEMDDSSDELVSPKVEKDEAIMAIGEDGQRYMVVEVINMEDEDQQVSQDSQEQHNGGMEIEELILPERKLFFNDPKVVLGFDVNIFKFNFSWLGARSHPWCALCAKNIWQNTDGQRHGTILWIWGSLRYAKFLSRSFSNEIFYFFFFHSTIQDEDEQIDDEHEISKSTIQLINFVE